MLLAQVDIGASFEEALSTVLSFIPKFLAFLLILIVGYFIAKAIGGIIEKVLERVGFDRAVERGGIRRALAQSKYDPSDILSKVVFYAIFLFVLQMAFGVFGPNPISDLLRGVISFLPKIFVAIIIVVVAAAIAAGVKEIIQASLGGLSYGNVLANIASITILAIGVFAALNQIEVAPEIVNGLFYAALALIVGSGIVAIGGGGIVPMRTQWEKVIDMAEDEIPAIKNEAQGSADGAGQRVPQVPADTSAVRPGPGGGPTI